MARSLAKQLYLSVTGLALLSYGSPLATSFANSITIAQSTQAQPPKISREVQCDILVAGGGLAGTAAAYEALLAGRTVCITEMSDWIGGQISSQGTSALDERTTQRQLLFYDRGYKDLRERLEQRYGILNPGGCWVSVACFLPKDGNEILSAMLQEAAQKGHGKLEWFPNTIIRDLNVSGSEITGAIAPLKSRKTCYTYRCKLA